MKGAAAFWAIYMNIFNAGNAEMETNILLFH